MSTDLCTFGMNMLCACARPTLVHGLNMRVFTTASLSYLLSLSLSSSLSLPTPCDSEIPCTSLCFWETLLIGGFTNGQIIIYNSESGAKMVEIAAHARCINALDIAPDAGLVSIRR